MSDDAFLSRIKHLRHAATIARNVLDGTDGDPVAAARLLAEVIAGGVEAIALACTKDGMADRIREAAPMLVTARMAAPEAFEEVRAFLAEIGAPPVLDDLPSAWSIPPQNLVGMDAGRMSYGIGHAIGVAAREIADSKAAQANDGDEVIDVGQVVAGALQRVGIAATMDQVAVVVDAVMDVLGYVVEPEDADVGPREPGAWPRTPWMMDFAPVPAAQHLDTVPDDVRVRYGAASRAMLSAMDLHPAAVVHAVFVEDMDRLPSAVPIAPEDASRLSHAWANFKDVAGWGPAVDRPDAVWYPLVRTPIVVATPAEPDVTTGVDYAFGTGPF